MVKKYNIPNLPLKTDLETKSVLKKVKEARAALAELKGVTGIIPNQGILINTLSLQEAKDSSTIENIITTHDDIFQSDAYAKQFSTLAAKEVHKYADALKTGYDNVNKEGLLTNNHIIEIFRTLKESEAEFRKVPGTSLKNDSTGEVIYEPPQSGKDVSNLMSNLEKFINNDELCDWDPLVKMAIIHHQFESIHPFYDGNGRTGRIINILYLVKQRLLDTPVLYLSRYINNNKDEYYKLLQDVRIFEDEEHWEQWILYVINGIEQTSRQTISLIRTMKSLMLYYKNEMRDKADKIYSQDLLNNLFSHPYTKIEFVERELHVHRHTATKYLDALVDIGLLDKHKMGKENFYLNTALFELLSSATNNNDSD